MAAIEGLSKARFGVVAALLTATFGVGNASAASAQRFVINDVLGLANLVKKTVKQGRMMNGDLSRGYSCRAIGQVVTAKG